MSTQSTLPNGLMEPWTTWSFYNNIEFVVTQLLNKTQTATLVKVISCTNDGGLSPIGTVNVQPLVHQVDSAGNAYPHATVYNVPYFRLGSVAGNGIILDPAPGDIGLCCFSSRDLTNVISTQDAATPNSARKYDYSDGLYVGLMLSGGTPTQYVQFAEGGISIVSPVAITLKAPVINLQGDVNQTEGTMSVETDLTAGPDSISSVHHLHTSEAPGSPTSAPLP